MAVSSIFNFAVNNINYQGVVDRTVTKIKGQLSAASAKKESALAAKNQALLQGFQYNLAKAHAKKAAIDKSLTTINKANAATDKILNYLSEAKAAAASGDRGTFDNDISSINRLVGNATSDATKITGYTGLDTAGERSTVFSLLNGSTSVQTQSLAATYTLTLSDGTTVYPDFTQDRVTVNDINYNTREMLFQSGSGNDVTFTVQGSDGNPATFTATVNKGGLGLAHSIFYGALPTDGSAASLAYQSQLASDIDAAIKIVQTVKFNLSLASSQITGADNLAGTAVNDAQSSYDKVQQQQSDAEAALKKAEDARNKIQLGIIGFAAKTQESQLTALFADPAASQPRTVLDLIGAHAKI